MKAGYAHRKMVRAVGIFCQLKSEGEAIPAQSVAGKSQENAFRLAA